MLIDILHPAHVHFFREFHGEMAARGHELRVLSRHKDVATELLDAYGIQHEVISSQRPGRWRLAAELAQRVRSTSQEIRAFRPDVIVGLMGPSIALAGFVHRTRTLVFYDNETTDRLNRAVARLADAWISPRGFEHDYGSRHLRYDGYHELAYLHPARFTPDASRLRTHGIDPTQPYSLMRFVAWESIHDVGEIGFGAAGKRRAIELLSRLGRVYISSERPLPPEFEHYRLPLPVEDVHHALAFATVVVGESSTMASEAACLGTHAVFVSRSGRGVNTEQERRYGLVRTFHGGREAEALTWIEHLASRDPHTIQHEARERREAMLADVIDVTGFLVDYVETGSTKLAHARDLKPPK
ncbi:hypothetical protein H0I76_14355 [Limibaculum sp. M0105]|uniref:DUF354 domain-containing protein n=1 Tax=Thermohalobaculum xanthum TaxID=2753746 RepID=A0A8J7M8R2_9RHOB|nr:hypothetical protein [Thermohalobaculum xanthum]MBK0400379.1 hypothetical protein [Thermohalobaculum xanthum]